MSDTGMFHLTPSRILRHGPRQRRSQSRSHARVTAHPRSCVDETCKSNTESVMVRPVLGDRRIPRQLGLPATLMSEGDPPHCERESTRSRQSQPCCERRDTSVAAVSEVVQQSKHRRGLAQISKNFRLEPEAAGDGEMSGGALVVKHVVRTTTVRSDSGDAEMEKNV